MDEDIFIVESFLKNKKMLLKHPCWVSEKTIQAIENLINKSKEQEKIIKLMTESIADSGIFSDSCQSKIEADECCDTCEKCIIDYFKKKASEENGIKRHN